MKKYIELLRIKHWIKNLLVFLPLFCSLNFNNTSILNTIFAFFIFSFASSFIYIINDIKDVEKDRKHPIKKNRPIANGSISINKAYIIGIIVLLLSLLADLFINQFNFTNSTICLLAYILINIGYSFGLKNVVILDVVLLASGFILRVYYGAFIINVPVSSWLFLTILNASLFLGLGKREKELLIKANIRSVLKNYDEKFLNNYINICLTLVIVFYSLWVKDQNNYYLYFSIPLLMILFMQYMLCMEKSDEGDPITLFFKNKSLFLLTILYIIFMFFIMIII